ncbi:hypothetical protein [Rhizobium grahamii]|uniref:Uncharacterized protein n=1 Tax=Rhizobium grahamii CCGE 502 TaxID=990285 RepID=S3HDC6_9HYPH|nr:hypothetical protein [Rhizobium grahamii]EPE96817.1 hypothetical protein RGCCGE502_17825 [Rhizobium grahamii CCGE 502]
MALLCLDFDTIRSFEMNHGDCADELFSDDRCLEAVPLGGGPLRAQLNTVAGDRRPDNEGVEVNPPLVASILSAPM